MRPVTCPPFVCAEAKMGGTAQGRLCPLHGFCVRRDCEARLHRTRATLHHTARQRRRAGDRLLITFEWIIGLLLGAVLLSALARRAKVPYPTFLALGGVALAFLPGSPSWTLEPDLALALFVAPVLLDAAFDTSPRDLRDNGLPVSTLVFIAVGLTTAAVAILARVLVPDMP